MNVRSLRAHAKTGDLARVREAPHFLLPCQRSTFIVLRSSQTNNVTAQTDKPLQDGRRAIKGERLTQQSGH